MNETRYMISDASKKLDVEPHVLRYWEEELEMNISRNEMGHRYYTSEDISILKNVKELKQQGFQLKAIKILMPEMNSSENFDIEKILSLKEELNRQVEDDGTSLLAAKKEANVCATNEFPNDKMAQFETIMTRLISNAMKESGTDIGKDISNQVSDKVIKEMDYLIRMNDEKEETRYKLLDETIREIQKSRQEAAASEEKMSKKKKKLFRKR